MGVAKERIKELIKNILCDLLKITQDNIKADENFIAMGVNSISVVELSQILSDELKFTVGIELIYDYPSPEELATYLAEEISLKKDKKTKEISGDEGEHNSKKFHTSQGEKIAVIGMSGKFAKADNLKEYWDNLLNSRSSIEVINRIGWKNNSFYSVDGQDNDKSISKWAGLISNISRFDANFFGISPREAERMDPQQRLLLEEVYKALEDSGYSRDKIQSKKVGVFVGARASDYINKDVFHEFGIESQMFLGSDMGIMAGRISYFLNIHGPSLTVDTACSSGLVALHLACESIRRGESSMAIAGGAFLMPSPDFLTQASKTGMLSVDGKCKTFDENANGIVVGEGVGAIILKPLSKAISDRDNIQAVICGSSMNQDGKTNGITAPSAKAQEQLILSAWDNSNVDPETLGYIEVHGTGTKLGDPIEVKALINSFKKRTEKKQFCYIGSHKPNIGHTINAAGLAGVFKTILSLKNRKIPPMINFEIPNEHIDFVNSPFLLNMEPKDWYSKPGESRKAGVSSFGFSGTNCHVILEEWKPSLTSKNPQDYFCFIPISAKSDIGLQKKIEQLKTFLIENDVIEIKNIARTLQEGRDHFKYRKAFVASDVKGLIELLDGETPTILISHTNEAYQDLIKLKEYYEKGGDVDWKKLKKIDDSQLISIPTYPFCGEDYWIQSKSVAKKYPFVSNLTVYADDVFIRDHYIQDHNLMPGAAQIVLICEYLEANENIKVVRIDNLYFLKPIILNGALFDLQMELKEEKEGYCIELTSVLDGIKVLHTKGLIITKSSEQPVIEHSREISIIPRAKKMSGREFYDKLLEKGAVYRNTLQVVEEIEWDEDSAFAILNRLYISHEEKYDKKINTISLLDGALQCLLIFAIEKQNMMFPFSIGQIQLIRPLEDKLKVSINKHDKYSYDITICDFEDKTCALIKEIVVKPAKKNISLDLFFPVWNQIEVPYLHNSNSKGKNILIVESITNWDISAKIKAFHQDDYVKSIVWNQDASSVLNTYSHIDKVYIICKMQQEEILLDDLEELEKSETWSLGVLYKLVGCMDSKWRESSINFTILTNNVYATDTSRSLQPYAALVIGFVKSMRKEYCNWNIRLFDINYELALDKLEDNFARDIKYVVSDIINNGEYLISNAKLYSQQLLPVTLPLNQKAPYKMGGVYLVIGGSGGIGLEYCKHLAVTAHARIVIIGRSAFDSQLKQRLNIINKCGGQYIYFQMDISKQDSLSPLISKVKEKFGVIQGVVHSALVLKDKEIRDMKETDLQDVLDPKVKGTWNLYNAFKGQPLDFMLFFSSCQSFVGNAGQSNYAAATSFQDALCNYLSTKSTFPIKVINWGYWGSVGVVSSGGYNRLMQIQGYHSIEPFEGMQIIDSVLSSPLQQLVAIKAEQYVYEEMGVNEKHEIKMNLKKTESICNELNWNIFDEDKKSIIISSFLTQLVKVQNVAKVKVVKNLDSYGFDNSPRFKRFLKELSQMTSDKQDLDYEILEDMYYKYPELKGFIKLISSCIENYELILRGKEEATNIMFPETSTKLVEAVYKNNPISDYFIEIVSRLVWSAVNSWKVKLKDCKLKIIEIGAGTGATAEKVCESICNFENISYTYTDISKVFLSYGGRNLGSLYEFVDFRLLDIEKNPMNQGYDEGEFDIVIATNVLHATKNISSALKNVKSLLKTNGLLLINEMTGKQDYLTLTFGLLDGWWKYEDGVYRESGSPIINKTNWRYLLSQEGYRNTRFIGMPVKDKEAWSQHVIISESDGYLKSIENIAPIGKSSSSVVQKMENTEEEDMKNLVAQNVCIAVSECLGLKTGQLDMQMPFADMGADSIVSVEIVMAINKALCINLKNTVLFDYNNTSVLIDYINTKYKNKISVDNFHENKSNTYNEGRQLLGNDTKNTVERDSENMIEKEVAIIGISGRFADYDDVNEFWEGLCKGKNSIREIPKERWDTNQYYDSNIENYQKTNSKWCGWLEGYDEFDSTFFNISGAEAIYTDPQQRVFLEECWKALEDAGHCGDKMKLYKYGVFAGVMEGDYLKRLQTLGITLEPQAFWGNDSAILASRISYLLDFHGPCVSINTACSSSLVAIELACQSIVTKECDVAIAGGAYVSSTPNYYILSSNAGMFSPTGQCKTFDQDADGFVLGEGAGTVILKSLEKAIEDGDFIYGVIKGIGVNQDGKTNGITAPSGLAQTDLEIEVYKMGEVRPETISYVEAHGTGTKLGDPIEFEALTNAFREYTDEKQFCGIGSVKTNIGHLSAASGVASLIKVLMALKNEKLPPTLNFNKINNNIDLEQSPFYVNNQLTPWVTKNSESRRAAISSFGFSGTNVHMVVEEWPVNNYIFEDATDRDVLLVFSAKSKERLERYLLKFIDFIRELVGHNNNKSTKIYTLSNIAYSLQVGRKEMKYRLAVIASDFSDLIGELNSYILNKKTVNIFTGEDERNTTDSDLLSGEPLRRSSLQQLASMWVKGKLIEWNDLYMKYQVMNVPLPKSIFQKRRYWFDKSKKEIETETLKSELYLYESKWIEVSDSSSKQVFNEKNVILILDNDDQIFRCIKSEIGEHKIENRANFILGIQSETLARVDVDKFKFNYLNIEGFFKLLEEEGIVPDKIVNLCSITQSAHWIEDYSLFYLKLVQALGNNSKKRYMSILHMFLNKNENDTAAQEALTGFARTLKTENSKEIFKTLMLDLKNNHLNYSGRKISSIVLYELEKSDGMEVRYGDNKRFIKQLKRADQQEEISNSLLKKEGTYIITGGMGGIGKIIARRLAKEYKARLAICGRSQLREETNLFLQELESFGAQARYFSVDLSEYENTDRIVGEIVNEFGSINGIIHCAGVVNRNFLVKKSSSEFKDTLSSKVMGTINLDKALKNKQLDFFALFSSISSELGTMYVGDYAYANSFLNAFARLREVRRKNGETSGKTISICWPFWMDGGMQIEEQGQDYMYEKYGLKSLSSDEGWKMFKSALASRKHQVIIMKGDQEKFEKSLIWNDKKVKKGTINEIEQILIQMCSELFEIPTEEIDINNSFEELGINSIFMIKLLSRIEDTFNQTVEPDAIINYPSVNKLSTYLSDLGIDVLESYKKNNRQDLSTYGGTPELVLNNVKEDSRIAVIGMSCRFPGADTLEEYWSNLVGGKELFSVIDPNRWAGLSYCNDMNQTTENEAKLKWGGFLENIDAFDAFHFNVKEEDAPMLDPQHRIVLELAQELFDDAGYTSEDIFGKTVNVLIGAGDSSYVKLHKKHIPVENYNHILTNMIPNMIAARISDYFNLKGESGIIDTACSSALVAIHKACEDIRTGKCSMAVAGGVKLLIDSFEVAGFNKAGILSEDGKVRVFDKHASGTVLGEGAGLVLLKDYKSAIRDGDHIWAVIAGSATNNDGNTMGLTVPSKEGQRDVISKAILQSGVDVNQIRYFEAHGTGTLLGDPIEIKAASEAYRQFTDQIGYCAVGSVKSNMGHLLQASGIAGFIKIILSLYKKKLVPTLNCKSPHPRFKFEETPFYPTIEIEEISNQGKNYAAMSSFGFGGTNCHIIVGDFCKDEVSNYKIVRKSLPKRLWKRNKYWLGQISSITHHDNNYQNLLEQLASGQLTPETAAKLIQRQSIMDKGEGGEE